MFHEILWPRVGTPARARHAERTDPGFHQSRDRPLTAQPCRRPAAIDYSPPASRRVYAYHYPGRIGRAVFTGTSLARAAPPEERAQALRARAAMIECGGYGFGERVAALLGAAASPQTIAVVQHTLRATNPTGSCRRRAS